MLDVKFLREQSEAVRKRISTRGAKIDWERFAALDQERRQVLTKLERLKEKKNQLSGEIGKAKKLGGAAAPLMKEVEELAEAIRKAEAPLAEIEARFDDFMLRIPNLPHESVPLGAGGTMMRRGAGIQTGQTSRATRIEMSLDAANRSVRATD